MSEERYFEIRKEIGLGLFNGREQYDRLIEPGQGFLLFNGRGICWVVEGQARISDTINDGHLDLTGARTHRRFIQYGRHPSTAFEPLVLRSPARQSRCRAICGFAASSAVTR